MPDLTLASGPTQDPGNRSKSSVQQFALQLVPDSLLLPTKVVGLTGSVGPCFSVSSPSFLRTCQKDHYEGNLEHFGGAAAAIVIRTTYYA